MSRAWYPFYPSDYEADTKHLSLELHGAYLLLMNYYYVSGKFVPNNVETLSKLWRCNARRAKRLRDNLLPFFEEKDGNLYHKRIEKELRKAAEKSSKSRYAANEKWRRERHASALSDNDASADANAYAETMPPQSQSHIHNSVERAVVSTKIVEPIKVDWQPSPDILKRCETSGCPAVSQDHINSFISHYRSAGKPLQNPGEKFLQWMVREKQFTTKSRNQSGHSKDYLQAQNPARPGETWEEYNARIQNLAERSRV